MKAYVSNIQKFCVHDGPGIRTVVFFMGCPLRCKWCQNPENFFAKPVIMYNQEVCTGCNKCINICPQNIDQIEIDKNKCTVCGKCAEACYAGAKTICGSEVGPEKIFAEVVKDIVFFEESGGGATLSGGEAILYPEFVGEFFSRLQAEGINTAIETSGYADRETIEKLLPITDMFLYDFKMKSDDKHKYWTGVSNKKILDNLEYIYNSGVRIIIRIPLIPNVNTDEEFVIMMDYLKGISDNWEVHILPFHQVGSSKYIQIDEEYEMEDVDECSPEIANAHEQIARSYGFKVNIGGWDTK